jgi:RNA-directed DNA polymerase
VDKYEGNPELLEKELSRTETRGGIFYDYDERGLPRGSPLSPLLGAIALMPLDQAMGEMTHVFYARFQDDWIVLTKSKTALRKVIKRPYKVIEDLKLKLHPLKTYIGKISHGFNFLGYYMDDQKILPSQETIRRFHERAVVI